MQSEVIDKWYLSIKKFIFRNNNGFFELPILSNSPESIVKSLTRMPFVKHSVKGKSFGSNNLFINALINYYEIEEGLWFMLSNAYYKENISYIRLNDNEDKSDYYLLFIEFTKTNFNPKQGLIDGIVYSNVTWVLLKPKTGNEHCRFKSNNTTSLALYMSKNWIENNIFTLEEFQKSALKTFFETKTKLIMWSEKIEIAEELEKEAKNIFNSIDNQGNIEKLFWKDFITKYLITFFKRNEIECSNINLYNLPQINRKKILEVEKFLIQNINAPFMGIQELSTRVGISPTKLKNDFKLIYGDTVFQFFRKKQLESAKIILSRKELNIKQIALLFGYSNPSKFTNAFKDQYGFLPSEIQ